MANSMISNQRIQPVWSGVDVSSTDVFKEALQADLLSRLWQSPELMQQLASKPKLFLKKELGLTLPDTVEVKVLHETVADTFYFIVPHRPIKSKARYARLERMGNWWMVAHTFWWHLRRPDKDDFRFASQAMIIGHVWSDPAFKQSLLANPTETLSKEIGLTFPEELQIEVLEDTATRYHLVIPQSPPRLPPQLPSEESVIDTDQLSEWWMRAHTFWAWLIWMSLHTPLSN
jgi:hypothetical protein